MFAYYLQGLVVKKFDNTIHKMNLYQWIAQKIIGFPYTFMFLSAG